MAAPVSLLMQTEDYREAIRLTKQTIANDISLAELQASFVDLNFVVGDQYWEINDLVIDTRNWLPRRKVLIWPSWINEVTWLTRQVRVDLTQETIKNSPEYDPSTPISEVYEERLYDFYGRPKN